jgi:hypothetical protein
MKGLHKKLSMKLNAQDVILFKFWILFIKVKLVFHMMLHIIFSKNCQ